MSTRTKNTRKVAKLPKRAPRRIYITERSLQRSEETRGTPESTLVAITLDQYASDDVEFIEVPAKDRVTRPRSEPNR